MAEPTAEDIDALVQVIEGAANMMLGMSLDPGIPEHAKACLIGKVEDLTEVAQEYIERFLE